MRYTYRGFVLGDPCVERVIKLDHDDDAYNKMLATPFLRPEISRALVF